MVKRAKSDESNANQPISGDFVDDSDSGASSSRKYTDVHEDDDPNAAEIVLSNKGGPKLIHRGYMYTLHKKQPQNIRWRCVGRTMHCRGSVVTATNCTKPRVRTEHNHKPDYAAAQVARKRYLALGKPRVLPGEGIEAIEALRKTASRNRTKCANPPKQDANLSSNQQKQQRTRPTGGRKKTKSAEGRSGRQV